MIPVSEADDSVTSNMLDNENPHPERVFIPGDDKSDEIAKLRERGASAMREGNYTVAADCMAKAAELESMPRVKPHWETSETDQAEGEYFGSLDLDQRREYLMAHEVVISRAQVVISLRGLEDPWL
jgi:hypothetical protein